MEEDFLRISQKLHKSTHNSMQNRGSTPILTNLVGIHTSNIHTKFEANPCSSLREEVEKTKKVHANDNNDDDGHSLIASHTHSLSVTKNLNSL